MENVSKALLISAAILIAMVLIAFILIIFDSTSGGAAGGIETSEQVINAGNTASQSATSALGGLSEWIK